MVSSSFTHTSILAVNLEESTQFYEEVFGMERVPSPNFSVPVEWLRCEDLQLHLFERDVEPAEFFHFGLDVDDFESVYQAIQASEAARFDRGGEGVDDDPVVYLLPDGSVQLYIRDPADNLLEVNYADGNDIDRTIVPEIVDRDDQIAQTGEASEAVLYHDERLAQLGR